MSPTRSFYSENYEEITPKPGTIIPISKKLAREESSHGEYEEIDGMIIRSTPNLEKFSNSLRNSFINKFQIAEYELKNLKHAFNNEIRNAEYNYNKIVVERLLPNLIYILTFTLTGSILVRNRNIGLRFFTPIIFGGIATSYYMPKTFQNLNYEVSNLEKQYIPELHKSRIDLNKDLQKWDSEFQKSRVKFNDDVIRNVHYWRKEIEKKFE
ncbi:uncharacterized protein KGF55_002547 [Candida pseudojiufengensis]|uniref:uncharacterized protein n=1 Tax=Candida pseudojiufengensis TaxID=497109 RepID=UPI0022258773|nr:uncharacterized protein KGF55_002547 [Candida pseudojiufengensis]KAI5963667.1 hypothetical protein KGF55_002547 [Candida pseudojiufengensis]